MSGSKRSKNSAKAAVNKGGRPPKITDEVLSKARALLGPPECLSVEEAAVRLGVGKTQLYARLGPSAAPPGQPSSPALSPAPPPAKPPQLVTAKLPQGGELATRPDLLALVRRILGARDPAALAELEAGLVEATRGEHELSAWLARPLERGEPVDPLEALARALDAATTHVEKLPPLHPRAATMLGAVATLGTKLENVAKGRPREERPDEVQERVRGAMGTCVDWLLRHTRERALRFEADRKSLAAWASQNLGPVQASELAGRLEALLGGAPQ